MKGRGRHIIGIGWEFAIAVAREAVFNIIWECTPA